MSEQKNKMWDGRFSKPVAKLMEEFNNSLHIDKIFIKEDVLGSIAWANALLGAGVLTQDECESIKKGLENILEKYEKGEIKFLDSDEDIHMAVERILGEEIGTLAKKLHTGRSRNDQVATDFRLFVKNSLKKTQKIIVKFLQAVFYRAETDKNIIMAGYTHYQQAQPVSMAHYWLSLFFLIKREYEKIGNTIKNIDVMPLGSGAIAGCGFEIDRQRLSNELGFSSPTYNSIDGVASRDFALDSLHNLTSISISLSRYAEDLIVWSTKEFSYVELDDAWATGSSMMPQKKNPDSLELIRGKTGRLIGNYTGFAAALKGIGLSYFKDLQEDKEPFIDSVNTVETELLVFENVLQTLKIKENNITKSLDPFLLATDVADYLVRKGLPFRQAHNIVGKIVGFCVENKKAFNSFEVSQLKKFSPLFEDDVKNCFDWNNALKSRDVFGGTGPASVTLQLKIAKDFLAEL
ncbi:MAG: argininosuccinate lyase [Chitinispirillales bacterium]|jgi:argininosuccinate lyase|nr:argininosuccinate lyase [Chitinispirillales bacterium]